MADIIVLDRAGYPAAEIERGDMAIAEGFCRFRWIFLHEATIQLRQIHAEMGVPDLPALYVSVRFTEIGLLVARRGA